MSAYQLKRWWRRYRPWFMRYKRDMVSITYIILFIIAIIVISLGLSSIVNVIIYEGGQDFGDEGDFVIGDIIVDQEGDIFVVKGLEWTNDDQFNYGTEFLNTQTNNGSIRLDEKLSDFKDVLFSDSSNYTYNPSNIEISDGKAKLKAAIAGDYNFPFTASGDYNFDSGKIEVIGGVAKLKGTPIIPHAWWHLNEVSGANVPDSSGNGRNGICINMEDADWVVGKLDNCLKFDGISEYVNCGDIANFERTTPFSVELWFKTTSTQIDSLIARMEGSDNRGWGIFISVDQQNRGRLRFYLQHSSTDALVVRTLIVDEYNDGIWHHIVVTYDGSSDVNGVTIYKNGVPQDLAVVMSTLTQTIVNSGYCQISGRNGNNFEFEGQIDEVAIYEKELTNAEVSDRWNDGFGTEIPLAAYYTDDPDIYPNTGYNFIVPIDIFTETATKSAGSGIQYQVSSDDGATWKWWSGVAWVVITGGQTDEWYYTNESNTASVISTNISSLSGSGTFRFRAFLHSTEGVVRPELDNIYIAEGLVYPTDSYEISMNNDIQHAKVFDWLTTTETVTKPANTNIKYQYSINSGSTWNSVWLTEPELEIEIQGISCICDGSDKIRFKFQLSTTDPTKTPEIDNLNIVFGQGYETTGHYISGAFTYYTYRYIIWKTISINTTVASGTSYKVYVRLSSNILSTDYEWQEINDGNVLNIKSLLGDVYFQWKVEMITTGRCTPILHSFNILYWEYILI